MEVRDWVIDGLDKIKFLSTLLFLLSGDALGDADSGRTSSIITSSSLLLSFEFWFRSCYSAVIISSRLKILSSGIDFLKLFMATLLLNITTDWLDLPFISELFIFDLILMKFSISSAWEASFMGLSSWLVLEIRFMLSVWIYICCSYFDTRFLAPTLFGRVCGPKM